MRTATLSWFAAHELRLAWRDWLGMISGGRRRRGPLIVLVMALTALVLHAMAWAALAPAMAAGIAPDVPTLLLVSGFGGLMVSAMLSQSLESVTRVYYARADLDLILASPAPAPRLFAVRAAGVVASTALLACLLASPLVNVLALGDGPHWLAAYPVLVALACLCVAVALLVTIGLFRLVGPRRTRLVAQIVAAVVGAAFVIGVQGGAILYYGDFSRLALFQSAAVAAAAPDVAAPLWWPARAAMGEALPLLGIVGGGLVGFLAALAVSAAGFGDRATAAGATDRSGARAHRGSPRFAPTGARQALRRKEWLLLRRDPWLVSQTLMQLLYLIPPALLLWLSFGTDTGGLIVAVAVLVMASGQLAGGLAWLAVSGEDAPDLVATAPLPPHAVLVAKLEAVLAVVALLLAPLLVLLAASSWPMALVTMACATLATAAATAIQLWFRTASRRAMFRRRQTASRAATICEALSSVMWAATGALWAAGTPVALLPALLALLVLGVARLLAPRRT